MPFIWRRNAGADSVSEDRPRDETMDDQARVNDVNGMSCKVRLFRRLFSLD